MRESALQQKILHFLKECGLIARSLEYKGRQGCPDLVVLDPPTVWLEVKTKTGRLRPAQVREHERMKKLGAKIHVIRSIEDARAVVAEHYPERSR